MKRIKKWQIIGLVVLGIAGYWLTQNRWVFEKQILKESYQETLTSNKWVDNDEIVWVFDNNTLSYIPFDPVIGNSEYSVNGKALVIRKQRTKLPIQMKILFFSKHTIVLHPFSPSTNSMSNPFIKLSKYEN